MLVAMPFCPLKISYGMLWHWKRAPLGKEGDERYELWHTAWINCCSVQRSKLISETYLICILFSYHLQLDFLGFPSYPPTNAAPTPARGPRTISSSLYPLHTLSILGDVNVPCSNSFINDRNTARCEVLIAVLIKVQSSGCVAVSTDNIYRILGALVSPSSVSSSPATEKSVTNFIGQDLTTHKTWTF